MKNCISLPLLFALVLFALGACTKEELRTPEAEQNSETMQTEAKKEKELVYQEDTGDWLTPAPDPYDLTLVQQAYNNLTKSRAVTPRRESLEITLKNGLKGLQPGILPEVSAEFEKPARKGFKLEPTHYVLKTFPNTKEQVEKIESDTRLDVRTYPTNYRPISAKEAREASNTRMGSAPRLAKKKKHTYTDPGGESTVGFIPPSEIELPVFYIVWPTDIAIPADLEHEVLYEVFLPKKELPAVSALNLSEGALQGLDFETNALARRAEQGLQLEANIVGGQPVDDDIPTYYAVTGRMLYTLNIPNITFGNKDVPLANIQVKFSVGSSSFLLNTDETGLFTTRGGVVDGKADISLVFHDAKNGYFHLVQNGSLATAGAGTVEENYNANAFNIRYRDLNSPLYESWIAANFYWHGAHPFIQPYVWAGRPFDVLVSSERALSYFQPQTGIYAYISITYQEGEVPSYGKFGAVFHELGHWIQWCLKGADWKGADDLIIESWACYVGWELGERYLESQGCYRNAYSNLWQTAVNRNPTNYSRQEWTGRGQYEYSPLFIDMADAYNQYETQGSFYPHDYIQIPNYHNLLKKVGAESTNLTNFKQIIYDYVCTAFPGNRIWQQDFFRILRLV